MLARRFCTNPKLLSMALIRPCRNWNGVYGLDANHAEALVDQLIVLDKDDPAGWRPSQTCFDLWHEGYIK